MKICISSGHGFYVRGASGIIDEVDEARLVVDSLAARLRLDGHEVRTFHDNSSKDQSTNLKTITNWHNAQGPHDLDMSVHFNAHQTTTKPMGTEVLYKTQAELAAELSAAIASVGFINRGAKKRPGDAGGSLAFLENTVAPAVLLEICFVDSDADCSIYDENYDEIINNIACVFGESEEIITEPPPMVTSALFNETGSCSFFGGPDDTGVSPSEGLAFHYEINTDNQYLFLPLQPTGTSGLARRLNPMVHYVACRWDYNITPKTMLAESGEVALVRALATGRELTARPADWGPHEEKTGRAADLSPKLMVDLGIQTDDIVEVIYPWRP
jgi:N-acetylmuramoyl-L-alanine amidase